VASLLHEGERSSGGSGRRQMSRDKVGINALLIRETNTKPEDQSAKKRATLAVPNRVGIRSLSKGRGHVLRESSDRVNVSSYI